MIDIRTTSIDNEEWFNLADVAREFNLYNPRQLSHRIKHNPTRKLKTDRLDTWHTTRNGLIELSEKDWAKPNLTEGAQRLREWLFGVEVHETPPEPSLSRLELLRMALEREEELEKLRQERDAALQLLDEVEEMPEEEPAPRVIIEKPVSMAEAAKIFGIGRVTLFRMLREARILQAGGEFHNTPFKKYADAFEVKTYPYFDKATGETRTGYVTTVKPEGMSLISSRLGL